MLELPKHQSRYGSFNLYWDNRSVVFEWRNTLTGQSLYSVYKRTPQESELMDKMFPEDSLERILRVVK